MLNEPTKIGQVLKILQNPKLTFSFYRRTKEPSKDLEKFWRSLGILREDVTNIIKGLTKYELVRGYAPNDKPTDPYHLWIFIHQFRLHPCDKPIPIYIKLEFKIDNNVIVISFHKDLKK